MRASNSAIQTFKACRRLYELKYVYGLEPVQTADALSRGLAYHEGVEELIERWNDYTYSTASAEKLSDDPKIRAMVFAFNVHVIPKLTLNCIKISEIKPEEWIEYETPSGHLVVGRVDGITTGHNVIEHKTTSGPIDGAYWQKLEFDEQIPTYMLGCNSQTVYYTVCQTPTIRQKKGESDEDFFDRCVHWYDEDTESKINVLTIRKTEKELERFREEQDAILTEMESCKLFYRNPSHCMKWGRMCEYASVCMNYDPSQEYVQFKRREDTYEKAGKAEVRARDCKTINADSVSDETSD